MSHFHGYIEIAKQCYREQFGLSFEQFAVGQTFKHRPGITISQQDNKNEALDTLNNMQLHYDYHYTSQTELNQCIVTNTLTVQYILGMTWKTFAKKLFITYFDDIALHNAIFPGDTLYAESKIIGKEEYTVDPNVGLLTVVTSGINQDNVLIAKIKYQILIFKTGKHHLEQQLPKGATATTEKRFASHRSLQDNTWVEQTGLPFEALMENNIFEHRPGKTLGAEEARIHAVRALNWNPKYANVRYLEQSHEGKMLVNEAFLVGSIVALTTRTFALISQQLQWQHIKIHQPVHVDETIYVETKIQSRWESDSHPKQGFIDTITRAYNQNGTLVCSFERQLAIYKKGLGPQESLGY